MEIDTKHSSSGTRAIGVKSWALIFFVLLVAAVLRIYHIDNRPFHNDEGVNWHFLKSIESSGYYRYSHENYHGPSYFYLTYAVFEGLGWISNLLNDCGDTIRAGADRLGLLKLAGSEFAMRASAVLSGLLGIILPFLFLKNERRAGVLAGAVLIALSPSNVFYSRYAIHETLFLLASCGIALSVYSWLTDGRPRFIYLGFLFLGLIIATKETFIVALFSIFVAAATIGAHREVLPRIRNQYSHFCGGFLICVFIVATMFTGGFQWIGGLREMFLAVPQWVSRNDSDVGHFKDWNWYLQAIGAPGKRGWPYPAEPWLFLGVVIPFAYLLISPERFARKLLSQEWALGRFLTVWTVISAAAYAFIKYKTPWLVINFTFPAALLLGWWIGELWSYGSLGRTLTSGALAIVLFLAILLVRYYVFLLPYGPRNPFSYTHTSAGMLDLTADIKRYVAQHPEAHILVGVNGYWPLPYYFRDLPIPPAYLPTNTPEKYASDKSIMILEKDTKWNEPGWAVKYYRLSDVEETRTFFKR